MDGSSVHPVETWTRLLDRNGAETAFYRSSATRLDAQGNPEEEVRFGPGGAVEGRRTFGPGGRVLEETTFKPGGSPENRHVHRYDEAGRETEHALLLGDGRLHGRWISAHDPSGRLIGRVWHNRDGVAEVAETFEYDEAGRLVRKERGNVASWTYEYDGKGRLVRTRGGYYSSDETDDEQIEYDDRGRIARRIRFHPGGEVRSITILRHGDESG